VSTTSKPHALIVSAVTTITALSRFVSLICYSPVFEGVIKYEPN
jgi:hypothetical protein